MQTGTSHPPVPPRLIFRPVSPISACSGRSELQSASLGLSSVLISSTAPPVRLHGSPTKPPPAFVPPPAPAALI
uniref:Uncharacterized protein n=1 Tax=Fagus sylvatica TaxID=28930 RepID=A0A2N9HLJ4_FAGSY